MSAAEPFHGSTDATLPSPEGRTWLGAIAALLSLLGLGYAAGAPGAVAGLLVAVAWYLLPVPYAVALGHVVLVVVTAADAPLVDLLPAEAGLLGLAFASVPREATPLADGALLAVALAVLTGTVALALAWGAGLPVAALSLLAVAVVLAYGIHRYELLAVGLLEVSDA